MSAFERAKLDLVRDLELHKIIGALMLRYGVTEIELTVADIEKLTSLYAEEGGPTLALDSTGDTLKLSLISAKSADEIREAAHLMSEQPKGGIC